VSGSIAPPAKKMTVLLTIAGNTFSQTFAAAPNITATFVWNGLDAYGRAPQGAVEAAITVN
jgi:hypothetical protein